MRVIGRRLPRITALPSARALQQAARHQAAGAALAAVHSTGIVKGVYRFRTHEEADQHAQEALARVIAANAAARRTGR